MEESYVLISIEKDLLSEITTSIAFISLEAIRKWLVTGADRAIAVSQDVSIVVPMMIDVVTVVKAVVIARYKCSKFFRVVFFVEEIIIDWPSKDKIGSSYLYEIFILVKIPIAVFCKFEE